jgi:hypothetical protein
MFLEGTTDGFGMREPGMERGSVPLLIVGGPNPMRVFFAIRDEEVAVFGGQASSLRRKLMAARFL